MLIPSFNEISEITKSRYSLVMLVSNRAKELVAGDTPKTKVASTKPVSIAMQEILDEQIVFGEPMSDREFQRLKREKEKEMELEVEKEAALEDVETV